MAPTAHSKIGASSMHRWANCPGSVRLSKDMPNTSSSYAEEGTRAHDLAEKMILSGPFADFPKDTDEETREAVRVYVDFIENQKYTWLKVEEKFDLSHLYPGLFGTSDAVLYFAEEKLLTVVDYKHGQGIAVEAENNEQLMYYALGALLKTQAPCTHVEVVVCQPRCYHPQGPIRKWRIEAIDLLDFAADLVDAAKRTEDPNAPLVAGDHCRFCPAAPVCPLLHHTAIETAQMEFTPALPYDPEKLAGVMAILPAIKAWAKAVEEFAFAEAERGRVIPGHKLVPKRAIRKWKHDEGDIETVLLHELGLDYIEVTESKLKSPAQIEKLLSKDQKAKLEELVIKQSSGNTLVPDSDKRQASKSSVETDFTVIE